MKYTLTSLLIFSFFFCMGQDNGNLLPKKQVTYKKFIEILDSTPKHYSTFTSLIISGVFPDSNKSTYPILNPYINTDAKILLPNTFDNCYNFEIKDGVGKVVAYQKCNNDTVVIIDSAATIKQLLFQQLRAIIGSRSTVTSFSYTYSKDIKK